MAQYHWHTIKKMCAIFFVRKPCRLPKCDLHQNNGALTCFSEEKNRLFLTESATGHGPADSRRHRELAALFAKSKAGLIFVTAFLNRATMSRHISGIAWETEVWTADAPSHIIHLDGERFLGPCPARDPAD